MKFVILGLCLAATAARAGDTVAKIEGAGHLTCGVVAESEDWNKEDLHGNLSALDREMCRAASIAVFGEGGHVVFRAYPVELDAERALAKGDVEMIAGVSPSATATMLHHIWFSPVYFYDDVALLVRKTSNIGSPAALAHRKLCYEQDTDLDRLVQARLIDRGIAAYPFPFQEEGEMDDALMGGHCDAIMAERSRLAQVRATYAEQAHELDLLPASFSLDPVAAATRQDDARWTAIVSWTIYALLQAEVSGVTAANARGYKPGDDQAGDRLVGIDWATGQALGLRKTWAVQVLSGVGNYGEIFERSVGAGSAYRLARGLNALWLSGGVMAPLPMR